MRPRTDVFRHEEFESLEHFLKVSNEEYSVSDQVESVDRFRDVMDALKDVVLLGERLTVDLDVLPDKYEGDFRLPYPIITMGLEWVSENEEDWRDGWAMRSIICIDQASWPQFKEGDPNRYLFIPIFMNLEGDWQPAGWSVGFDGGNLVTSDMIEIVALNGLGEAALHNAPDLAATVMQTLAGVSTMLACSNIELETIKPSGLRKMRMAKKGRKLNDLHTIKLPQPVKVGNRLGGGGHHASPRLHHRRGHPRVYHRGERYERTVWIPPTMVGDPALGRIKHEYQIRER